MTKQQREYRDLVATGSARLRKLMERALTHSCDIAVGMAASSLFSMANQYLDSQRCKLTRCVICNYFRHAAIEHCPICACIVIEGYAIDSATGIPMVKGEPAVTKRQKQELRQDGSGRRNIGMVMKKGSRN